MPDDPHLPSETLRLLAATFPVDPALSVPAGTITLDDVRRFLIERIGFLLDRNPGLLMSILYRIDVAEAKVTRALTDAAPADLPALLADLVIERQLQKLHHRRRYRDDAAPPGRSG
ncbi:hypothetical protein GQ464_006765 [Rhodocaloribacter litoris]|uniref:hypothetical protein n=1 Tax=Rhodocaloribacter litoris TaxID=2558931 RepID=UPI0014238354|nr:hypothetical protein [Rhodocaloribacter litoris]QXD16636.1 hypothetical protein GQ464_006765 [Rhodocaloribacter litoris]GIV59366.1 MAG: hypothetical protein KatS3mg043_0455 [Rhodothermaceae bacterium]